MDIALWILRLILAAVFLVAGLAKLACARSTQDRDAQWFRRSLAATSL